MENKKPFVTDESSDAERSEEIKAMGAALRKVGELRKQKRAERFKDEFEENTMETTNKEQQLREAANEYSKAQAIPWVKSLQSNSFIDGAKSEAAKAYHQQSTVNVEELRKGLYSHYTKELDRFLTPRGLDVIIDFFFPHLQPQQKQCDAVKFAEWKDKTFYKHKEKYISYENIRVMSLHVDKIMGLSLEEVYRQFLTSKTNG